MKSKPARGYWMETEPQDYKKRGFNPVVIRNEPGVVQLRPLKKDNEKREPQNETVKVIAM